MDLEQAAGRARDVRALYARLEATHHGAEWTPAEMVVGLNQDIGDLGRLVMAADGRWGHGNDVPAELGYELAECFWWLLALADRFDVDLGTAFEAFADEREQRLAPAVARLTDE